MRYHLIYTRTGDHIPWPDGRGFKHCKFGGGDLKPMIRIANHMWGGTNSLVVVRLVDDKGNLAYINSTMW